MRYEIDEKNAIRIWQGGVDIPFLFQPNYPDGTPWADKADAENWAKAKIAEHTDIDAFSAPNSPNELPRVQYRKTLAEKEEAQKTGMQKLIALGLTETEALAIAGTAI